MPDGRVVAAGYHPCTMVSPTLTVVMVGYAAGPERTRQTLTAACTESSYPHQTTLLLNASPVLKADVVAGWGLDAAVVTLADNVGYAGAINWALDHCTTDLVAILNDDATVQPGTWRALVEGFGPLPASRISATTAMILNAGETEESANGTLNLAGRIIPGRFADRSQVLYPSGACMVLRRDLPFRADPDYFLYYEDVLLGLAARLAGYRPTLAPAARVLHQHHASMHTIEASELAFLRERNRLMTLWTIFEDATLAKLDGYWRQERELLRLGALVGQGKLAAVERAERWMQEHAGEIAAKREALQATRQVSDDELIQYFSYRLLPSHVPGATLFNRRAKHYCESTGLLTWDLRDESRGRYPLPLAGGPA